MPDAGLRSRVEAVPGEPSPYGLLHGCAEVVTASDPHQLNGTDALSAGCSSTNIWQDCPSEDFPNPAEKVFDRPDTVSFEPITVYKGITCSTFGMTFEEGQRFALEQLALGEQNSLEAWFMERWLCPTAVDLTPIAGALSIPQGVGALEGWLATNYGGKGVIHAPAGAAALLSSERVVNVDGDPVTRMGNCVVLGAGYAANLGGVGCVVAPSGEAWLYITPPVRVRRDTPGLVLENEGQSVRYVTNDRFALAESTFVIEVACEAAAAVRVSLC